MAHQRQSELNRFEPEGIQSETPYGSPSDDLHPDGEPNRGTTPPGAPEPGTKLNRDETIDWGRRPGEETVVEHAPEKPDKAA
ncbi:MAG TPA: hypothetical protein VFQ00_14075 [Terriglobales bacterium]|nr:hypothetical protein [Terriglobales bacterium]